MGRALLLATAACLLLAACDGGPPEQPAVVEEPRPTPPWKQAACLDKTIPAGWERSDEYRGGIEPADGIGIRTAPETLGFSGNGLDDDHQRWVELSLSTRWSGYRLVPAPDRIASLVQEGLYEEAPRPGIAPFRFYQGPGPGEAHNHPGIYVAAGQGWSCETVGPPEPGRENPSLYCQIISLDPGFSAHVRFPQTAEADIARLTREVDALVRTMARPCAASKDAP